MRYRTPEQIASWMALYYRSQRRMGIRSPWPRDFRLPVGSVWPDEA